MLYVIFVKCVQIRAVYFRGRLDMVKLLIASGANTHSRTDVPRKTPMQLAAAGGHIDVLDELVKKGMNWKEKDDWGWTLLHEVAASGDAEGIKWVSTRSRGLANVQDKLGRTPLLTALIAGAGADAVSELLNHGEDPGMEDEVGRTSAEAAILYCSAEVVEIIMDAISKKNESLVDREDKIEVDYEKLNMLAEDHAEMEKVKLILNKC